MKFEIYRDNNDEWRWRLISSNGRIMADSGESYKSKQGVMKAINTIQRLARWAANP